ncbi:hypothetical protein BI308_23080 [Roseofilum reptotaenium AO1-A]|uniref:Uncharacterized protein n=1 Tax=Roseofilum reptotaenium AO1-A TaxID=1925591 RepID=A0A1L9QKJ0_9CYAN|nr:hypothetical protein BI308_23080 [Roseofilum reptotaenium AO1-A]
MTILKPEQIEQLLKYCPWLEEIFAPGGYPPWGDTEEEIIKTLLKHLEQSTPTEEFLTLAKDLLGFRVGGKAEEYRTICNRLVRHFFKQQNKCNDQQLQLTDQIRDCEYLEEALLLNLQDLKKLKKELTSLREDIYTAFSLTGDKDLDDDDIAF